MPIGFGASKRWIGTADNTHSHGLGDQGDSGNDLANVAAVVTVLEQADVELGTERDEELLESSWSLGEGEHVEALVGDAGSSTDEISDVALGELVGAEFFGSLVGGGCEGDTDEDVGDFVCGVSVAELCDTVGHDVVDEFGESTRTLGDLDRKKSFLALTHGGTFSDKSQAIKVHVGAGRHSDKVALRIVRGVLADRLRHGVGILSLDTDDLDVGSHALDIETDSSNETAAADTAEDSLHLGHVDLAEQFVSDSALTSNDIGVVERGDVDESILDLSSSTLLLGGVKVSAVQHDMAAETGNVEMLDTGSRFGHDDGRGDLELASGIGDALGMVTGGAADYALPALLGVEMGHLVVSAAQLEAENGLLVFTLEEDIAFEPVAQVDGVGEGSDFAGLVDSRSSAGDETKTHVRVSSREEVFLGNNLFEASLLLCGRCRGVCAILGQGHSGHRRLRTRVVICSIGGAIDSAIGRDGHDGISRRHREGVKR
ncbi:hypothetical protein HG531_002556 [Fusarium graminearum]|nr:hypothetical protein HG531_002556 [Fusarium graminearum]